MPDNREAQATQVRYLQKAIPSLAGVPFEELAGVASDLFRLETWEVCPECKGCGCEHCGRVGVFRRPRQYAAACVACGAELSGIPGAAVVCWHCDAYYSPAQWNCLLWHGDETFQEEAKAGLWMEPIPPPFYYYEEGGMVQACKVAAPTAEDLAHVVCGTPTD